MEMIKNLFFVAVCALLSLSVHAESESTDYYKPIPYKPAKVTKATVDKPSEKSGLAPDEDCHTFVMKPALVTEFFRHARSVSEHVRMHELDWSACYAEGTVNFANGDAGSWLIARYGVGALTLTKGKLKGKTVYFHCAKCEEWNR